MKVGLLTSWRVPCGIYQHSSRFADALARRGAEVTILALRADEHRSVPEESAHEVVDVGRIGLWSDDGLYRLDCDLIWSLGLDVLHVQYQSMLIQQPALYELASGFGGVRAITFHDSCVLPDFPTGVFDLLFTHRAGVGSGRAQVIPFGIENRPAVVRTFGLGRTRSDLIAPICERNGWVFEDASSHEPIHGGGQAWQTHEDLIAWLRGADAIVLWYDDVAAAGSSQAARTALAARRPVITNDTTWFRDLPPSLVSSRGADYQKVTTPGELERVLCSALEPHPYVAQYSWDAVAAGLLDRYAARVPA